MLCGTGNACAGSLSLLSPAGHVLAGATIRSVRHRAGRAVAIPYERLRAHQVVIGSTGTGKSTLLHCLAGILVRRSGMNGPGTVGLGLRLAVSGGREAVTRLVIPAAAVGLGVGLLLTAVAASNAVTAWNNRHAWFWTGTQWAAPGAGHGQWWTTQCAAVVAPGQRHLRRPDDQPLRRRGHRRFLAGAAGAVP